MASPDQLNKRNQRNLLYRIMWPLGLGLLLVAVSISIWLGKRSENRLTDLLYSRAEAIAHSLQETSGLLSSTGEVQGYLIKLRRNIDGLEGIAVVRENGSVLAFSDDETGADSLVIPPETELEGLVKMKGGRYVYAIPIRFHESAVAAATGGTVTGEGTDRTHLALVALDSSQAIANVRSNVLSLLIAGLVGLSLVCVFCYLLIRRYVVNPINDIQTALAHPSEETVDIPVPRLDEIGELAVVLQQAMQKIQSQEAQLSSMISNVPGCVYRFHGHTFKAVMVSPQCEILTGYPPEHFQSIDDLLCCLAEDQAKVFREVNKACLEGTSWSIDHRMVHRSGERRWGNTTGKAVYGRDGEILFIDGLVIDTTERVRQQRALKESEQRYQRAIKSSSDGIWEWRRDSGELYVSPGFTHLLGKADVEKLSIDELLKERLHKDDREWLQQHISDCLTQGIDLEAEFRLRADNGRLLWFLAKGQCSRDEDGKATGLAGSVTHISKRKTAEKLLKDTATRLGAVLNHVADGILLLDTEGRIKSANPAIERLLNCSEQDLEDLAFGHFFSLEDATTIDWRVLARKGELKGYVSRSRGGRIPVEAIARAMNYGDEEMYTLVVRDVSERKRAQQELIKAKERAEAATRAKSEFLATMSHEIRTPMNGVLGMTQLLMDMGLTQEQKETARVIYASGESLLTIINDILDFSKIEAGKLEIEAIPFDMRTSVGEVLELLSGRVEEKSLQLFVDFPIDVNHCLRGDPGRIRQVLMNLIGNAIKFTEQGHIVVRVEERSHRENEVELKFSIEDTGIGIDEATRSRLFESFTQADTSTTRRFGGTGLGLAISRQLVELMGGGIGVESVPGEGSTFWFTLRLPLDACPIENDYPTPDLTGKRALIVDDNEIGRRILLRILTRLGMNVSAAASAEDCLELLHASKEGYDIALLDYQMPMIDGESLIERIRANPDWHSVKLLMLTSSGLVGERQRMLDLGLDRYLLKPVLHRPLFHALSELLIEPAEQHRAARRNSPKVRVSHAKTSLAGLRVLLAEDNIVNQKVAVRMLEKIGCVVDIAANGEEAFNMWKKFPYAMIFMDCQMPEIDGFEATRRIRAREDRNVGKTSEFDEQKRRTPIIAMTANAMDGDEKNCLEAGMDDYAAKPVKSEILQALVARWGCAVETTLVANGVEDVEGAVSADRAPATAAEFGALAEKSALADDSKKPRPPR